MDRKKEIKKLARKIDKIIIDKESCISCELCVNLYPEVFELDKTGHSSVKKDFNINMADKKIINRVLEECPVQAMRLARLRNPS